MFFDAQRRFQQHGLSTNAQPAVINYMEDLQRTYGNLRGCASRSDINQFAHQRRTEQLESTRKIQGLKSQLKLYERRINRLSEQLYDLQNAPVVSGDQRDSGPGVGRDGGRVLPPVPNDAPTREGQVISNTLQNVTNGSDANNNDAPARDPRVPVHEARVEEVVDEQRPAADPGRSEPERTEPDVGGPRGEHGAAQ